MPTKTGLLLGRPVQFQEDKNGDSSLVGGMRIVPADSQLAGQITGTLVNTYIHGPNVYSPDGFLIGSHPANTSYISYGMQSGTPGMTVDKGDSKYVPVDNLNQLYLAVATSGDKIVWQMI